MVVGVIFSITLQDEAAAESFLQKFAALQQHCIHNEPGTLNYELHQVMEGGKIVPLKYLVLERYNSLSCLETIHNVSQPFQDFIASLSSIAIKEQHLVVTTTEQVQPLLHAKPQVWSASHVVSPLLRKGVLVFGGARHGNKEAYAAEARSLANCIATDLKQPAVYGGGTVGIMGELAKETKRVGGTVVAVIPESLCQREASGDMIGDVIYFTSTMSERKSIMFAHADTVVALPGGVGTFDELLEVITLFQLNAYRPKIALVNVEGFFDPLITMLQHFIDEGFVEKAVFDFLVIKPTAVEVVAALKAFVPPASPAASLQWNGRP